MTTNDIMKSRLKYNRPSLRARARPPKNRTPLGEAFSAANMGKSLQLQCCVDCHRFQYPSQEVCQVCLNDSLVWRATAGEGHIISQTALYNSLWEFFKRRIKKKPWPIATVSLDEGPIVFAHLDVEEFDKDKILDVSESTQVKVFSHYDCSMRSILIATNKDIFTDTKEARRKIVIRMGLSEPAFRDGGI